MEKKAKKRSKLWIILLALLAALVGAALIFARFGGFGVGDTANVEEFTACAGEIDDIALPDGAKVIALGEASHGNSEFQQLKLDVFRLMVEKYGVRAFALEGDYGGCEQVNRYIHGGEGTAQEAAAAIGFAIYRTEEMAELISYMREYNDSCEDGEDLRFYGFDMQRYLYSYDFLLEQCRALELDSIAIEELLDGEGWSEAYGLTDRIQRITEVKTMLEGKENSAQAVHLADALLQNFALEGGTDAEYADLRDRMMADNVKWIAEQEAELGFERIFVSAHNGHVARWGSYDAMGKLLSDELGDAYYVIGTDFYKTTCNMPNASYAGRTNQTFYSHDPLANAAKKAGLDICWLDFSAIPDGSELAAQAAGYSYMGSLGEGYVWYMRVLPQSYRIFQPPAELYDGMIFVTEALPTSIAPQEA